MFYICTAIRYCNTMLLCPAFDFLTFKTNSIMTSPMKSTSSLQLCHLLTTVCTEKKRPKCFYDIFYKFRGFWWNVLRSFLVNLSQNHVNGLYASGVENWYQMPHNMGCCRQIWFWPEVNINNAATSGVPQRALAAKLQGNLARHGWAMMF